MQAITKKAPASGGPGPVAWFGHLAVWPALYALGVLWMLAWLLDARDHPAAIANRWPLGVFVLLCAHAGYLLDRAKVAPRLLDPADDAANPHRFRVFARYGGAIRALVWAELVIAACVAFWIQPLLALVPGGVAAGVIVYAGRPATDARPRPKDIRLLKSLFITAAHVALPVAVLLALLGVGPLLELASIEAVGAVALIVFADAVTCDLDDAHADRAFGTRSIPATMGRAAAWWVIALATAAGMVLIALSLGWRRALLPSCLLAGSLVIAAWLPARKDFTDARLPAIALICALTT